MGCAEAALPLQTALIPLFLSIVLLLFFPLSSSATRFPIRINSGPSLSYPPNSHSQQASNAGGRRRSASGVHLTHSQSAVAVSRRPAAFALPPALVDRWHVSEAGEELVGAAGGSVDSAYEEALWRRWDGDCLTASVAGLTASEAYTYSLCPFQNVTQRSQSINLHVSLGVWHSWTLTSARQLAMRFTDGAPCSPAVNRSTTVVLHCSSSSSSSSSSSDASSASSSALPASRSIEDESEFAAPFLGSITEPRVCSYRMQLHLPIVCRLYDRLTAERGWRRQRRSGATAGKRLEAWEALDELDDAALPADDAANAEWSAEERAMLDCIAAMSQPAALPVSYEAVCAAYLPGDRRRRQQAAGTETDV